MPPDPPLVKPWKTVDGSNQALPLPYQTTTRLVMHGHHSLASIICRTFVTASIRGRRLRRLGRCCSHLEGLVMRSWKGDFFTTYTLFVAFPCCSLCAWPSVVPPFRIRIQPRPLVHTYTTIYLPLSNSRHCRWAVP